MECKYCGVDNPVQPNLCGGCGRQLTFDPHTEDMIVPRQPYRICNPDMGEGFDYLSDRQYCYAHPRIETVLSCGNCDRPICAKCLVHHPVGIRCRDCAKMRPLPIFHVTSWHYLKAIVVVLALSVAMIFVIGFLLPMIGHFSPLIFYLRLAGLGMMGYLAGESVSLAVNRKRSVGLKLIASSSVVIVYLVSGIAMYLTVFGFIVMIVAVLLAIRPFRS